MLAEVAGSSLEPTHISSPLRSALRRTDVIRGRVEHVDLDQHVVLVGAEAGKSVRTLPFDHLVLALGSVSNFLGLTGVRDTALDVKSLADAMVIRNQVIDAFERASDSPDAAQRHALLTFVVAGGGFAGVELACRVERLRAWHAGQLSARRAWGRAHRTGPLSGADPAGAERASRRLRLEPPRQTRGDVQTECARGRRAARCGAPRTQQADPRPHADVDSRSDT